MMKYATVPAPQAKMISSRTYMTAKRIRYEREAVSYDISAITTESIRIRSVDASISKTPKISAEVGFFELCLISVDGFTLFFSVSSSSYILS